ncbi:MAG TPA: hypothetical protein VGO58_10990 [Chitinophagaceae bacterium]|jgi:hypothetical protein|nr:hypothetical protein [Chitinophagaceae bacterium]
MKKIFLIPVLLFFAIAISAQTNLSGTWGYSFKPEGNPPKEAVNAGPSGKLVLLKMENNKYRFWLDVTMGWPSYNVGETDGTIVFVNDTASFDNTFEGAEKPCILKFKIASNVININAMSTSFNCGFGNGVNADGDYAKLTTQPALNNQWLKKEYPEAATIVITTERSEVFQDENMQHPFTPKQYFSKGESMPGIVQTENSIYTEYITASGKFMYGWIKKSSVKISKTE